MIKIARSKEETEFIRNNYKKFVTLPILIKDLKIFFKHLHLSEKAKSDIDKIKDKADFIIVAIHWGEEHVTDPNESQKKIASYLSSLGVNLIIGNQYTASPDDRRYFGVLCAW